MKTYALIVATIISAQWPSANAMSSVGLDHLEPSAFTAYPKYQKLLIGKLGATPYECGRLLVLPFSEGEDCQSVYSKLNKGRRIYYITRTSAEKSLWHETDGGQNPQLARAVAIRRVDAEIPEQTANLLKQVWLRMLQGPRGPKPTPTPSPHILPQLHPMYFEFTIERGDRRALVGALNLSAGCPGDKTKRLADLAEATYRYCIAEDAKRPAIAKSIDKKAQILLQLLH